MQLTVPNNYDFRLALIDQTDNRITLLL